MTPTVHVIPPCDTRRREKVGALYSTVSGLLAFISRAYPRFLSPVPRNICACRVRDGTVLYLARAMDSIVHRPMSDGTLHRPMSGTVHRPMSGTVHRPMSDGTLHEWYCT